MTVDPHLFLARHREARLDAITDRLVEAIVLDNAGYSDMPVVPLDDLRRSCHDNVLRVLQLLDRAFVGESLAGDWYDAADETGHRRAVQGLPLDSVLGSFRIGGRLIWEDLVAAADEGGIDAADLRAIGTRLWEVVDRTSSHVARAYHRTEHDLVRADEQRSAALWEELLRGRAQEPAFAATFAQTLDIPLDGAYLAVALSGAAHDLREPLRAAGVASAFHRRTDSVIGVLAPGAAPVATVLEVLSAAGARAGVSAPVPGLSAIDEALRQAAVALRSLPPGVAEVASYDDRLVAGLLLGSPEVADRLVSRWLGPVLALGPGESRVLLQTLAAWVNARGAMTRTAVLAHCHRNTAMNRINRIAGLIGVPLVEGAVPVEIELALRWLDLRG
jgi:hypothetical protein